MTSIVNNTKSATALDYVFRTGMIFWSDVSEQTIYKAPIDEGNERMGVVTGSKVTVDGLAVDWIYNHIYYADTKQCTIAVTNFDGTMTKELIKDDIEIPRALALDPIHGFMYWTGIYQLIRCDFKNDFQRKFVAEYFRDVFLYVENLYVPKLLQFHLINRANVSML